MGAGGDGGTGDREVLALVRHHWSPEVDRVEALPGLPGRWQALVGFRPTLFVRLHSGPDVEATLAAVAELSFGLDVVVACLPTPRGWSVPAGGGPPGARGRLSAAPWVHGETPDDEPAATLALLGRLHTVRPPRGLPRWTPLDVDHARYRELAELAGSRPWVTTHGRPTPRHQLDTPVRRLLVGWARARLAPRERDLVDVGGPHPDADPEMLELFDLERRLA